MLLSRLPAVGEFLDLRIERLRQHDLESDVFIAAAAITNGDLEIKDCQPRHLSTVIDKFREAGLKIEVLNPSTLRVCCPETLTAKDVTTQPYPKFPTDMQAQYTALMTQADGRAVIEETVFENRFMHASELQRMGARISIDGK